MSWEELPLDRIYYDATRGVPGTVWPIGTPVVPSNTIADIITICAARNIHKIEVEGALTLGAAMQHYCFRGNYHEGIVDIVNLNTKDVDNSRFERLVITGAQAGAGFATYIDCLLYNMSGFRGLAKDCAIYGTLAVATGDTDWADFDHCTSVHGVVTVTIASPDRVSFKKFSGGLILTAQAAGAVLVRGIDGYLEVDAMAGGTLDIYADAADIQINANCAAGTINIYGNARVTDLGAGATINNYTLDTNLATVDTVVDAIKVSTDKLAGAAPVSGATAAYDWNTAGGGTSTEGGGDVVTIGANDTKYKLHSLLLDVSALTDGAIIHVKLFMQVNGNEKKVYDQAFTIPTGTTPPDTDGLWIVNGTVGIHEALRVEVYSDTSESVAIGYDYMLEAM